MTLEKSKHDSLMDFRQRIPAATWVQIPMNSLSKEDRLLLEGDNPMERRMNALNSCSTRDLVIQMVSELEEAVATLLRNYSVEKPGAELFKRPGKLTFALQTDLAYALGLLTEKEVQTARKLAHIRNAFAHDSKLFELEHDDKVLSYTRQLGDPKNDPPGAIPLRLRFFGNVVGLIQRLEKRSEEALKNRCVERTELPQAPENL